MMQTDTITNVRKTTERRSSLDEEDEEEVSTSEDSQRDDISTTAPQRNSNYVCSEDEIGVMMDYNFDESPDGADSRSVSTSERNPSRRRHRSRRSRRTTFQRTCNNTWCLPFFSGVFTGLIFLIIGIVFIAYFQSLPDYIGILFILVSIPPFCMAVNKYRTARHEALMRQRIEMRRQALRDLRESGRENSAYRGGQLPGTDLPPTYDNLAFQDADRALDSDVEEGLQRNSSWSSSSQTVLPSYGELIKSQKGKSDLIREVSVISEAELPKYEESEVNDVERTHEGDSSTNSHDSPI